MKSIFILILFVLQALAITKKPEVFTSVKTQFNVHKEKKDEVWMSGEYFTKRTGYFQRQLFVSLNVMMANKVSKSYEIVLAYMQFPYQKHPTRNKHKYESVTCYMLNHHLKRVKKQKEGGI